MYSSINLSMRELQNGKSAPNVGLKLALFVSIWHCARAMNKVSLDVKANSDYLTAIQDEKLISPEADGIRDLCEEFLGLYEQFDHTKFENCLSGLYRYHDLYLGSVKDVTLALQEL